MIKFGPAGFGGVKEAVSNLENYNKLGLKACEIPFTYRVWINKEQAEKIANEVKKKGIDVELSIHAPYFSNLNSKEKVKVENTKKRILKCCEIAHYINAKRVVFHCGYYSEDRENSFENIKQGVIEMKEIISRNKWDVKLCPETMGKINVFGSIEEILKLVKEAGCSFCLDFAHLLARSNGSMSYEEIYGKFKEFNDLHCHFSGIIFGEKGERSHKLTEESEIKKLLSILPRNKEITIINESPEPVEDAVKMLKLSH